MPTITNNTCVYLHTRLDGVVFYVGIGNSKRPYIDSNRNPHWNNTTSKYAYMVTILYKNLSWGAACVLEVELIKKYRAISGDKLCNITEGGEGAKGVIHSEETKKRKSISQKGKMHSEETRAKISATNLGRKMSAEAVAKVKAAWVFRAPASEETRAKIGAAQKGTNRSEETRAKMSAASMGVLKSEAHKAKLRDANLGKTHSHETLAKMRASNKAYWLKRKAAQLAEVSV